MAKASEVLKNEHPEGVKAPSKFELKTKTGGKVVATGNKFDFLGSDNLEVVENGIKETAAGVDKAILALCLAVFKIEDEGLYKQAGFDFYLEYFTAAEDRLNVPASTISNYRKIGETYTKYRHQLRASGFNENGSAHKLRYLDEALKKHPEEEVWERIVNDSLRSFQAWAENDSDVIDEKSRESENHVTIEVSDDRILLNGQNILVLPKDLPAKEKTKIQKRLREVYRIEAAGNLPYIVETQSTGEQRAIDNFLKKFREKK